MEPEEELQSVSDALLVSRKSQLQAEVMCTAMKLLQNNPSISIQWALELAIKEWDI